LPNKIELGAVSLELTALFYVRFAMLIMTCVLRNPKFAGKMDWGIEWTVKARIQRDA